MLLVQAVEVVTAVDDRDRAERMAMESVALRVCACAQVSGPVSSSYEWKGSRETSTEWTVTFKAPLPLRDKLAGFVRDMHPYELPEILCREVLVSQEYFEWMESVTTRSRVQG
jgi:periplasmic divalent cation tolerance protein